VETGEDGDESLQGMNAAETGGDGDEFLYPCLAPLNCTNVQFFFKHYCSGALNVSLRELLGWRQPAR